jgi:hypothetical protein
MDRGPDRYDPGQFNRYNQHQSNSAYSISYRGDLPEGWSPHEYFHLEPAPLDMNRIQAGTLFEPDHGGIPSDFIKDFTNSQSNSEMVTVNVGNDYSSLVWTTPPNGIPEVYGSPPISSVATEYANSYQCTVGDATTAQTPIVALNSLLYSDEPISAHLPIMLEPMGDEYMESPEFALRQSSRSLPTRGAGGNPFNSILTYVLPTSVSVFFRLCSANLHLIISVDDALCTASIPLAMCPTTLMILPACFAFCSSRSAI